MKNTKTIIAISTAAVVAGVVLASGCTSQSPAPAGDATLVRDSSSLFPYVQKTGGQIWAENCTRCHNPRPSTQYSPAQWDVIMAHMRVRANLNGVEQRAVYQFMAGT